MWLDEEKQNKINDLLERMKKNIVSPDDIERFIKFTLKNLETSKGEMMSLSSKNLETIRQGIARIEKLNEEQAKTLDEKTSTATKQFETDLATLKKMINKIKFVKGPQGEPGVNPDPKDVVPLVLAEIKLPEQKEILLDGRKEIVEKINTGKKKDLKIEATQISGLTEMHNDTLNRAVSILDQRTKFLINKQTTASGGGGTWGSITGTLSDQTDLQSALDAKQGDITLTTTGTSGAATLIGDTLNIPQYAASITGSDTQVLFFDGADNPAGDAGFTYNKTTDVARLGGLTIGMSAQTNIPLNVKANSTTAVAGIFQESSSNKEVEIGVYAGDGFIQGYDRVADSIQPLYVAGSTFRIVTGTANLASGTRISIDSSGATTIGNSNLGATSKALVVNNGTSTGNIFEAQDNGTAVFTVADGGTTTINGTTAVTGYSTAPSATTSGVYLSTSANNPSFLLSRSTNTTQKRMWDAAMISDGVFSFRAVNDAYSAATDWLTATGGYNIPITVAMPYSVTIGASITGTAKGLTVNNGTSTGNIFEAQDNGTARFTITDGDGTTNAQLGTKTFAVGTGTLTNSAFYTIVSNMTDSIGIGYSGANLITSAQDSTMSTYAPLYIQASELVLGYQGITTVNNISTGNLFRVQDNSVTVFEVQDGGNIVLGGGTSASELRFLEPSGSGTNYTAFKATAQAGDIVYTLPTAYPAVTGYVLSATDAGVMSWVANGGASGITIGTTTITSGTNTRILYNNAGVVGEYTLSGSGTVVAMQTSPSFVTPDINTATADSLQAGTTSSGLLILNNDGVTVASFGVGAAASTNIAFAGSVALGANNLTMTGSLAATGSRVTKGWFTDVESTNMYTVGGTSLSSTFAPIASPTFTGTVTLPTTSLTGVMTLAENTSIALDPAGSADGKYTGITIAGTAGATLAFGDLVYLSSVDSRWELADADAASTADRMLGMCVLAAASDGDPTVLLLMGQIRADAAFPALTIGSPVYVGETAGDIQVAIPTGADNVIRRVGYALTADEIYFNPSMDSQISVA